MEHVVNIPSIIEQFTKSKEKASLKLLFHVDTTNGLQFDFETELSNFAFQFFTDLEKLQKDNDREKVEQGI
jgi:hypothetical protein